MILVDTSIWIDFFRGKENQYTKALEKIILNEEDIAICGVILTEIYQGIVNKKQLLQVEKYFEFLIYLEIDKEDYKDAGRIYSYARKKGFTIRSTIDCIIASCAIRYQIPLLQKDKDFNNIEKISKLRLYE